MDSPSDTEYSLDRRSFTALLGLAGAGSLGKTPAGLDTPSTVQMQADGTLVVGVPSLPSSLNLFEQRSDLLGIFGALYDPGIVFNPTSGEIEPWLFTTWVKQSRTNPTKILGVMREDLTWHDGTPVTAEDVVFTARYLREHHDIAPRFEMFKLLNEVESPQEGRVTYTFDAGIGAWQSHLLGQLVLPKHIWQDVRNPTQYAPTDAGGPIGSGPFLVDEFTDSTLRLERRGKGYTHPPARAADYIDDGPHIDAIEFQEIPSDPDQAVSRLIRGDVTGLSYTDRFGLRSQQSRIRQAKGVHFERSPSFSLRRIGFNLRLSPLSDPAFRHFLARAWSNEFYFQRVDDDWATPGDLVAPPEITDLRPFEPGSSESDRYAFVGEDGVVDVGRLRRMLMNDDSDNNYNFRDAKTMSKEKLPNGELYLNGQPFGTSWDGEGPIRLLVANPLPVVENALQNWVSQLRRVGVPITLEVVSQAKLEARVYHNHDFHIYEDLWHVDDSLLTDLPMDYGKLGINPDGYSYNPMGYTGSQYIRKARNTTDLSQRNEYITQALTEIYTDLPVMVYAYPAIYEPVHSNWEGWIHAGGGITNRFTWLNLQQTGPYTGGMPSQQTPTGTANQTGTAPGNQTTTPSEDGDGGIGVSPNTYLTIGAGGIGTIGGLLGLKWLWGRIAGK